MSPDLQELEAKLSALRPAALDPELLARLADSATNSATNSPTTLSPDAADVEALLSGLRPAAMPSTLAAALAAVSAPPQPAIIPFPAARSQRRPMLAAAAAVAMLGAAAGLLVPRQAGLETPVAAGPTAPQTRTAPAEPTPNLIPAAFNTGLSQASDEGVVWQGAKSPQRVVKVVYKDRVTLVDPSGRKIEVEQPRIEYILVPEKID